MTVGVSSPKNPSSGAKNIVVNNAYNPWDGVSTEEVTPNAAGEYEVASPAQLAWVAATVNGGEKFEGKTVKLTSDIDLAGHAWTPIGNGSRFRIRSYRQPVQGYVRR